MREGWNNGGIPYPPEGTFILYFFNGFPIIWVRAGRADYILHAGPGPISDPGPYFMRPDLTEILNIMTGFPRTSPLLAAFALITASVVQAQTTRATEPDAIIAECGGNPQAGEPIFATECSACHALSPEGAPKRGPHLQDIAGRRVAGVEGYEYSAPFRVIGVSGKVWEREDLHDFISDPEGYIPGNRMEHPGIPDEQTRRDLMTYLRIASLSPPPEQGTLRLSEEILSLAGDREYGEYLGGECLTCHQEAQSGKGIPQINGMDRHAFIYAMHEYHLRARPNQAMQMVAGTLGDEEIAALAAYFTADAPEADGDTAVD